MEQKDKQKNDNPAVEPADPVPLSSDTARGKTAGSPLLGLVVALLPAAISVGAVTMVATHTAQMPRFNNFGPVLLILNLAGSFTGAFMLLKAPGRNKVVVVFGGFFLGVFFFLLNIVVGVLGGCACAAGLNH